MPSIAEVTQRRGQKWSPVLETSVRCIGLQGDTWQAHVLRMSAVHSSALAAILGLAGGQPCVYRWSPFQEQIPSTMPILQPFSSLWRQLLNLCWCELPGNGGHPAALWSFPCELWLCFTFPFSISLSANPSKARSLLLRGLPYARAEGKSSPVNCLTWLQCHHPAGGNNFCCWLI